MKKLGLVLAIVMLVSPGYASEKNPLSSKYAHTQYFFKALQNEEESIHAFSFFYGMVHAYDDIDLIDRTKIEGSSPYDLLLRFYDFAMKRSGIVNSGIITTGVLFKNFLHKNDLLNDKNRPLSTINLLYGDTKK